MGALTSMKNPSSRNTSTFPNLAMPSANALSLQLTRQSACLLRAAKTSDKPALFHVQLRENRENSGRTAPAAARILVGAHGLRRARVRGEGEGVCEEEGACGHDPQRTRRGRRCRCRRGAEARHGQGEAAWWTWRGGPLLQRRTLPAHFGSRRHFQHLRPESMPMFLRNLKSPPDNSSQLCLTR